jgi:SET domain-containing protein
MMEYYATRDIKTGDEILCDYREFAMLDSWEDMGL